MLTGLVRLVGHELGIIYLSFSDVLKSCSMMYGGEHIFPFCETTMDSFTFNGDYGIVGHQYLYTSFSFMVIS